MKRWQLVNWLIEQNGYKSYLEIGIDKPENCHHMVVCERKTGVDPRVGKTVVPTHYRLTSDAFFTQNKERFDIVFVDGLHVDQQVLRDVDHSLAVLNPGGTIILHDCHPYNERSGAESPIPGHPWSGTVWRAWGQLRRTRPDLTMRVYNQDCGCGIIQRGQQVCYPGPCETWADYADHQDELLLLIDDAQLEALYGRGSHA